MVVNIWKCGELQSLDHAMHTRTLRETHNCCQTHLPDESMSLENLGGISSPEDTSSGNSAARSSSK